MRGLMEIKYHPLGETWATWSWDCVLPRGAGCWGGVGSLPVCGGLARAPRGEGGMVPKKDWEEKLGMFG